MTKPDGGVGMATVERCRWCGRPFERLPGPGRPRTYCRRSCRQRDFEARRRSLEAGLSDGELVVTRRALSELDDLAYVLSCAVEDVERQLAAGMEGDEVVEALEWLLAAARPIAERSAGGQLLGAP